MAVVTASAGVRQLARQRLRQLVPLRHVGALESRDRLGSLRRGAQNSKNADPDSTRPPMQCCSSQRPAGHPTARRPPRATPSRVDQHAATGMATETVQPPGQTAQDEELEELERQAKLELGPLKMRELRQRVVAVEGVPADAVEAALDESEHPKAALIELATARRRQALLAARHQATEQAEATRLSQEAEAAALAELVAMKMGELRRAAAGAGVAAEDVEEADDHEHPKTALIEMVVGARRRAAADGAEKGAPFPKRKPAAGDGGPRGVAVERAQAAAVVEQAVAGEHRSEQEGAEVLRAELGRMKMGQLRRWASEVVATEMLDSALDCVTPRQAIIELVLAQHRETVASPSEDVARQPQEQQQEQQDASLRADLLALRVSELKQRALAAGIVQSEIEQADDNDGGPKAALVDLIISIKMKESEEVEEEEEEEEDEDEEDEDDGGAVEMAERAKVEQLRVELLALRVSELKQRALAAGIAQSEIDEADDNEGGPKAALVDLIVSMEMKASEKDDDRGAAGAAERARVEKLRGELLALRVSELKQRAFSAGIAQSEIDEADDNEGGPKAALVECIIRMGMTASEEDGGAAEAAERARVEKLRGELLVLRVSELKRRALGAGVAQSEIDEADDNEGGPTAALVDLILSKPCHVGAAKACHAMAQLEERRAGLRELRLSELRRRAIAAGVDSAGMDAADDSAEPKAELIELLISAPPATQVPATHGQSRSHFGDRKSSDGKRPSGQQKVTRLRSADDRAAAIQLGESKHVMLSYQVGHARHAS